MFVSDMLVLFFGLYMYIDCLTHMLVDNSCIELAFTMFQINEMILEHINCWPNIENKCVKSKYNKQITIFQ